MSTVFPDADPLPVAPPADDEELLEQPAAAIAAIANAATAGVSLLPFKVCILSLTGSSACRDRANTPQSTIKGKPPGAPRLPRRRPVAWPPKCVSAISLVIGLAQFRGWGRNNRHGRKVSSLGQS